MQEVESIRQKFKRFRGIIRNVVRNNKSPADPTAAMEGTVSDLFVGNEDLVPWFASDIFYRGKGKMHLSEAWGIELQWRSKKETFGESTVSVKPSSEVVLDARAKSVYQFGDSPLPPIDNNPGDAHMDKEDSDSSSSSDKSRRSSGSSIESVHGNSTPIGDDATQQGISSYRKRPPNRAPNSPSPPGSPLSPTDIVDGESGRIQKKRKKVYFARMGGKTIREYDDRWFQEVAIALIPKMRSSIMDDIAPKARVFIDEIMGRIMELALRGKDDGGKEAHLQELESKAVRLAKLQAEMRGAYQALSEDYAEQKKILSLAVTSHTRERVNQDIFLDGEFAEEGDGETISKYKWGVARNDRLRFGPGLAKRELMSKPSQTTRLRKYDPEPFHIADEIISSNVFIQSTSYGTHTVYLDNGDAVVLPSYIKKLDGVSAFDLYLKQLNSPQTDAITQQQFSDFYNMKAPASPKMLAALDSQTVETIHRLPGILKESIMIITECPANSMYRTPLLEMCDETFEHLRHGLKTHLRKKSACNEHSLDHWLGPFKDQHNKSATRGTAS